MRFTLALVPLHTPNKIPSWEIYTCNNMFKWQSISFISRLTALVIGILQGSLVIRILSVQDWGSIQLILGAAAIIGTSQALGLTSGTTREIVGAKNNADAFRVFITSLIIRLLLSLPFLLLFFIMADELTKNLPNPNLGVWAIKIIIIAMLFDTATGIFNTVLAGFRKYKVLFTYQILRAFVSFLAYVSLSYYFGFAGFFYGFLLFNLLNFLFLLVLSLRYFDKPLPSINFTQFKLHAVNIFSISIVVYIVKLLFSFWDRSPDLFLNSFLNIPITEVAIVSLALVYCRKLMVFSDALTDVTLPEMSKKFFEDVEGFKKTYVKNFSLTFVLISFFAVLAILWSKEIVILYTGKTEFLNSSYLVPFIMLGVWSYSKINLLKSSIFIPAKKLLELTAVYVSLPILTYLSFFIINSLFQMTILLVFSIAFGIGGFLSLIIGLLFIKKGLNIKLLGLVEWLFFLLSLIFAGAFYLNMSFMFKLLLTLSISGVYLAYFYQKGLLNKIYAKIIK